MKHNCQPDNLQTTYHLPTRIISEENTVGSNFLFEKRPRQCLFSPDDECFLLKKNGSIVLDFGKELQGGLVISVHSTPHANLHIVFGESVSEAMSKLGEKNSQNSHSIRDYFFPVTTMTTFQTGNTGFRFVKISTDCDVRFNTIQAFCTMQHFERIGSFSCDDELLNKIWETGVYTVNLNMQEYVLEGIKRDRLVWIGDMNPEINVILSVFGNVQCMVRSLDVMAQDLNNKKWINNIATYSMWWLINQYDIFMYDGNVEYLNLRKETIFSILTTLTNEIHDDSSFGTSDDWLMVDWSSEGTKYSLSGFYALLMITLKYGLVFCDVLKNYNLKNICQKKLDLISKVTYEFDGNKQMTALKYLSGTLSDDEAFRILTDGGAKGLSCFIGYYVLMSLAKMKKTDTFLDIIRQYWGGQLQMGATTFWEDFDIEWIKNASRIDEIVERGKIDIHGDNGKHCYRGFRHSLCHGWSCGPTAILSRYVLGVSPSSPGFKKVMISPQLGSLKFAKGSIPTPYGTIHIEHTNSNGKITTKINAPANIEISCDSDIVINE